MFICHLLVVYYYQGFLPTHLPLSSFHSCALVVETVVFMQFSAILCRTLPHFANPCIIVELECRGKQIVFLSLFCFSLFCPRMPCFARISWVMMICSENADCGKSEQDWASYYYLLVVKLVVKWEFLLLRGFTNFTSAWTVNVLFRISNSPIINIISFIF